MLGLTTKNSHIAECRKQPRRKRQEGNKICLFNHPKPFFCTLCTGVIKICAFRSRSRANQRRPVSLVGWVSHHGAGGCEFEPWPDQHSGSLNNRIESAAFVITSATEWLDSIAFSDRDDKP